MRSLPLRRCEACDREPVARCRRCEAPCCARHAPTAGMRCAACEREWQDGARSRNAIKGMFAPALTILAGGAVFGTLLPFVVGSLAGACAVAALTTAAGVSAGVGTARLVDGAARAQFRREKARALPAARARIVHHHRALPPGRPG